MKIHVYKLCNFKSYMHELSCRSKKQVMLIWNSRSGVRLTERIGNKISNRFDHSQFMILSESIIQDGGDGALHRFI